jgi:hypothetical protein
LTLDADLFTDGSSETFTAYVHDANTGGTEFATSGVITVADTSLTPVISYDSVAFSPTAINEDGVTNTTFTVNTSNVVNGTTVGYTITGVTVDDISLGSLTGNITITGNTGTVVFNAIADATTEGTEVATLTLAATDSVGTSTGSLSDTVTINDTSLTPSPVSLGNITDTIASITTTGSTVYAGHRFNSNGTGDILQSEGSINWGPNGNWYTPTTGGIGASYDIFATLDTHTNAPGGGGTMSTWIDLNTSPEWSLSATSGGVDRTAEITFQIRDGTTLTVLSTRSFTIFVAGLA